MYKKVIKTGSEARQAFIKGAEKAEEIIGRTMGHKGRNVIISEKYKAPQVINDGVTVARKTVLDDEIEDLAFQTIVNVCMSTNEQAGDGTTTSAVIASRLIKKCLETIEADMTGGDPVGMGERIVEEGQKAVSLLKKQARKLEKEELVNVIRTSLRDKEISKIVAEMLETLGKDCYISVEDNWKTRYGIETETITGWRNYGTYFSKYFTNTKNKKEAVWEDTYILITNHKIESSGVVGKVIKDIQDSGKMRLVIITGHEGGDGFSKQFIVGCLGALTQSYKGNSNALQVLCVKAPALTSEELEDLAQFTGGLFVDKKLGTKLQNLRLQDLGYAKKVVVDEDIILAIGGNGNTTDRLKTLNEQLEQEKDQMFAEKMKRRIASLSSGVGIIRVGAPTESEQSFLRFKIEDAVNAAKAALDEGVVEGGGLALKKVADELGPDSIIYDALNAPKEIIEQNAGGAVKIKDTVIDPLKVTRLAVENACSAAAKVVASDIGIADKNKTLLEELRKAISPVDDGDFRDENNG